MMFYDSARDKESVSKTMFWNIRKSYSKYLIEPVVYWHLCGSFRKKTVQCIKKALRLSLKVYALLRLCKTPKTISKIMFWSFQKSCSKYLIKPVVYWYFRSPFRKKDIKSMQKALRFPLKVDAVLQLCKTSKTVSKTTFWSFQKSWTKYLIKPVVYWSFWGPFPKKALKSIKKALRFSLKRACVFAKSRNLIKPMENWWFHGSIFPPWGLDHTQDGFWPCGAEEAVANSPLAGLRNRIYFSLVR